MDAPVKGFNSNGANAEKAKALQVALAQIEKQFGKGSIMRLGQNNAVATPRAHSLLLLTSGGAHRSGLRRRMPRPPHWDPPTGLCLPLGRCLWVNPLLPPPLLPGAGLRRHGFDRWRPVYPLSGSHPGASPPALPPRLLAGLYPPFCLMSRLGTARAERVLARWHAEAGSADRARSRTQGPTAYRVSVVGYC